jgi:hypothetical protein
MTFRTVMRYMQFYNHRIAATLNSLEIWFVSGMAIHNCKYIYTMYVCVIYIYILYIYICNK